VSCTHGGRVSPRSAAPLAPNQSSLLAAWPVLTLPELWMGGALVDEIAAPLTGAGG